MAAKATIAVVTAAILFVEVESIISPWFGFLGRACGRFLAPSNETVTGSHQENA
jgi:hypothetical protein